MLDNTYSLSPLVIPSICNKEVNKFNIFKYKEKQKDDRLKVLSIRSFASRKYANDLSVNAILLLSEKKNELNVC